MNIVGAGGHAKVILDIVHSTGRTIEGIYDENFDGAFFCNYCVVGNFQSLKEGNQDHIILAIGNNAVRKKLSEQIDSSRFAKAVHARAYVAPTVAVGLGTVIMANVSINPYATIGRHVIINTNASVDHDCVIDDYAHISPQVGLAGNVTIGEGTHIGIGACVIQGIRIGRWATVGAGAAVIRDVPDYAVVVGNPARIIKYNKSI